MRKLAVLLTVFFAFQTAGAVSTNTILGKGEEWKGYPVPENCKKVLGYVKLLKNSNIRRTPEFRRDNIISVEPKGSIFPVFRCVSSPYGIFYLIGKGMYISEKVVEFVPYL
jgi:hypothetical protein